MDLSHLPSFPMKTSPPSSPTYPPLSPCDYMDGPLGPYLQSFYSPLSLYIDQDGAARAWLREQYRCSLSRTDKSLPLHQYPSFGNPFVFYSEPCPPYYTGESTGFGVKSENQCLLEPKPVIPDAAASVYNCRNCLATAKRPVVTSCSQVYCWACLFEPICNGEVTECTILPHHGEQRSDIPRGIAMDHGLDLEEGNAMEEVMNQEVSQAAQARPKRNRVNPKWMKDYICC